MSQDLDHVMTKASTLEEAQLPFPWSHSFKLLGVILDCHWHFGEHFGEVQKKQPEGCR